MSRTVRFFPLSLFFKPQREKICLHGLFLYYSYSSLSLSIAVVSVASLRYIAALFVADCVKAPTRVTELPLPSHLRVISSFMGHFYRLPHITHLSNIDQKHLMQPSLKLSLYHLINYPCISCAVERTVEWRSISGWGKEEGTVEFSAQKDMK